MRPFRQEAYAKPDCELCHGSGAWRYNHNHSQPCPRCCKHNEGFWALTPEYEGYSEGNRWCCLAGCGFVLPFNPESQEAS